MAILGIGNQTLRCNKVVSGDDGRMIISGVILPLFIPVLFGFMVQIAWRPGLSSEDIAAVPFILQNGEHGSRCPLRVSELCESPQFHQGLCDLLTAIAIQVHEKAQANSQRFIFIDHQPPVLIQIIPQQGWSEEDAHGEPHIHRAIHRPALGMGFLLCQR